jgi:hypothetical protein
VYGCSERRPNAACKSEAQTVKVVAAGCEGEQQKFMADLDQVVGKFPCDAAEADIHDGVGSLGLSCPATR